LLLLFEHYSRAAGENKLQRDDVQGAIETYKQWTIEEFENECYRNESLEKLDTLCDVVRPDMKFEIADLLVANYPNSPMAWKQLLDEYERKGEHEGAISRLKMELDGKNFAVLLTLGDAYSTWSAANFLELSKPWSMRCSCILRSGIFTNVARE